MVLPLLNVMRQVHQLKIYLNKKGGIIMAKKTTVHRSAGNGKFVTKAYADKHPKTTVKETVKK